MDSIDFVISGHDSGRPRSFYSKHKRQEVDLSERAISDDTIDSHSFVLLVVADEMLRRSNDVLLLNAIAIFSCERTREIRVF